MSSGDGTFDRRRSSVAGDGISRARTEREPGERASDRRRRGWIHVAAVHHRSATGRFRRASVRRPSAHRPPARRSTASFPARVAMSLDPAAATASTPRDTSAVVSRRLMRSYDSRRLPASSTGAVTLYVISRACRIARPPVGRRTTSTPRSRIRCEIVASPRGLVSAERNRGCEPRVDAHNPLPGSPSAVHQRLVQRHVVGAACRGCHEEPPPSTRHDRHSSERPGDEAGGLTLT